MSVIGGERESWCLWMEEWGWEWGEKELVSMNEGELVSRDGGGGGAGEGRAGVMNGRGGADIRSRGVGGRCQ